MDRARREPGSAPTPQRDYSGSFTTPVPPSVGLGEGVLLAEVATISEKGPSSLQEHGQEGRGTRPQWTPRGRGLLAGSSNIQAGTRPWQPCLGRRPVLGTLWPSSRAPPAPLPLPSLPQFPSSGPCWRGGPSEAVSRRDDGAGRMWYVCRVGKALPRPRRGGLGGAGAHRSTPDASIYYEIPAESGGWAGGAGQKGTGGREGHRVACAGDVLDEVHVGGIPLLLLGALAGCPLPLEVVPLGGACAEEGASACPSPSRPRAARSRLAQGCAEVPWR